MAMREINNVNDRYRVPKPKSVKEVPKYLVTLVSTFMTRLFYIFKLVWDTRRSLLFWMLFMSLFNGVMPVILIPAGHCSNTVIGAVNIPLKTLLAGVISELKTLL